MDYNYFINGPVNDPTTRLGRLAAPDAYSSSLKSLFYTNNSQAIPSPLSITDFLTTTKQLRAAETITKTVVIVDGEEVEYTSTPTLEKSSAQLKDSDAQLLANSIDTEAALSQIQMYLDSYMAPSHSDIDYRLGKVTAIKSNNVANELVDNSYALRTPQTNGLGALYTRANFVTNFQVVYPHLRTNTVKDYAYVNLFFPPFKIDDPDELQSTLMDIHTVYSDTKSDYYIENEDTLKAKVTYDSVSGLSYRPDYTYREIGFKALNDNINLLQYLLEQISGVVSTYMTEWDLSVYMQEGLMSMKYGQPSLIYMNHRVKLDNPLKENSNRAFTFGVVNAAVSKLQKTNYLTFDPSQYPLSAFYVPYPERTSGSGNEIYPKFYDWASIDYNNLNSLNSIDYIQSETIFKKKIELSDYKRAALSGYTNWHLPYWKVFYTTGGDNLSSVDVDLLTLEGNIPNALSTMRETAKKNYKNGGTDGFSVGIGDDKTVSSREINSNVEAANKIAAGYSPASAFLGDDTKPAPTLGVPQNNPTLYGGPHGVYLSPKSAQAYFEYQNIFLRDLPRVAGEHFNNYTQTNKRSYFSGNDRYYFGGADSNPTPIADSSPAYGLHKMKTGFNSYITRTYLQEVAVPYAFTGRMVWTHVGWKEERYRHWVRWWRYEWRTRMVKVYAWRPNYDLARGPQGQKVESWTSGTYYQLQTTTSFVHYQREYYHRNYFYGSYYNSFYQSFSSYSWYWNNLVSRRWYYKYSGDWSTWGTYYTETRNVPKRNGTYHIWVQKTYRQYNLENQPNLEWNIGKFKTSEGHISVTYSSSSFWNWLFGGHSARNVPHYTVEYKNNIRYKLNLPSGRWGYGMDLIYSRYFNTSKEADFVRSIFGASGNGYNTGVEGRKTRVLFCEGSQQSYYDRMSNGPETIFDLELQVKSYYVTIYIWQWTHSSRHRCHRHQHYGWIPHYRKVTYIDVNPSSVTFFRNGLNRPGWSNAHYHFDDMMSKGVPTDSYRRKYAFFEALFDKQAYTTGIPTSGAPGGGAPYTASVNSIRGWGILTNIPGTETRVVDSTVEADIVRSLGEYYYRPSQALNIINWQNRFADSWGWLKTARKTTQQIYDTYRFIDLPIPTFRIKKFNTGIAVDSSGFGRYVPNGVPIYELVSNDGFDKGLKRAIIRMYTTSTFYPSRTENQNQAFSINSDAPVRLLANQIAYQASFLKSVRDYLFGENSGIDFTLLKNVLGEYIETKVLKVSDKTKDTYNKDSVDYQYWVEQALEFFTGNVAEKKKEVLKRLNDKIATFENVINTEKVGSTGSVLHRVDKAQVENWTPGELMRAFSDIYLVRKKLEDDYVETFFYTYLTILYEYRKYFINMRMNKSDGTLWITRQLESILPIFAELASVSSPTPVSELSDNVNTYVVSYYDIQNTLQAKTNALRNWKTEPALDADRITRVYIKVEYVTEQDYINDNGEGNIIKIMKPVYKTTYDSFGNEVLAQPLQAKGEVLRGFAKKPKDGEYYLDSNERAENDRNVKFNMSLDPSDQSALRYVRDDIDFAHWPIIWENTTGKTPIFFDMFLGVDMAKLNAAGSTGDIVIDLCNSKDTGDFWMVSIPQASPWPRATGYTQNVAIKTYNEDKVTSAEYSVSETLAGVFANQLYPITEEQATVNPGIAIEQTVDYIKEGMIGTTL